RSTRVMGARACREVATGVAEAKPVPRRGTGVRTRVNPRRAACDRAAAPRPCGRAPSLQPAFTDGGCNTGGSWIAARRQSDVAATGGVFGPARPDGPRTAEHDEVMFSRSGVICVSIVVAAMGGACGDTSQSGSCDDDACTG